MVGLDEARARSPPPCRQLARHQLALASCFQVIWYRVVLVISRTLSLVSNIAARTPPRFAYPRQPILAQHMLQRMPTVMAIPVFLVGVAIPISPQTAFSYSSPASPSFHSPPPPNQNASQIAGGR
eukprot:2885503-Pyramimonas_sp.AAC.1